MGKKGFELSLNMVIILAIALIALIVILLIFSGGTSDFVQKLQGIVSEIWAAKPNMTSSS